MTDDEIYDKPSHVTAKDGVVEVKGPDAVDVRMTPDAADETSGRLLQGAMRAQGQKIMGQRKGAKGPPNAEAGK